MENRTPPYVLKHRGLTRKEIHGLACLHQTLIEGGFLASLGLSALELLYDEIASNPRCRLVVGFSPQGGEPVGYICGTLNCGALYREFLLKKGPRVLFSFLPRLLSLRRLRGALETLFYPARREFSKLPKAEILNFAILPEYRGTALAGELFGELMDYFREKGARRVKIVTGANQERAQRFYEKLGATLVGRLAVHRGRESLIYVYDIV